VESSPPSEPAPPRAPWHDTPTCPLERSGSPCGGPLTAADELLGPGELWCCACGCKSAATPEQVAQAKRADAAWEVEQDRSFRKLGEERLQDGALTLGMVREAVAFLDANGIKPDADGMLSLPVVRCQECGEAGAKACSYKCGAVLCEAHGAERQPPDCPPQMDEYLRDTAAPEPGWVRDPLFGVSTEDGE
jgi:hypothetical protein